MSPPDWGLGEKFFEDLRRQHDESIDLGRRIGRGQRHMECVVEAMRIANEGGTASDVFEALMNMSREGDL